MSPAAIPARIGRYRVLRALGRGAMGAVYEVQADGEQERRALKILLTTSPKTTERFLREARILEFLGRHPNVVGLHELGQEQGRPFLVMQLVEGGNLADRIEEGNLGPEEGARLVAQVGAALEFAHEAGVIHRDLKSANILLDGAGKALVTDFGIARNLQEQTLTKTGDMVGTPAFMAPEQAREAKHVDRRTDVYALGAVLYHVLTGRAPFEGPGLRVVAAVLTQEPEPPRTLNPDVPPALEAVCLKALAKDPERRQQTAAGFVRDLEVALGDPDATPPLDRKRVAAVGLGAIVAGTLLGLGLGTGLSGPSRHEQAPGPPVETSDPTPPAADLRSPGERTLAADLRSQGERTLAAQAFLKRSEDATLAWRAQAALVDQAWDLDLRVALERSELSGRILLRAAREVLRARQPKPAAVDLARRRLVRVRLLLPREPLRRECASLQRLGRSADEAVRLAARPWIAQVPDVEAIDRVVARVTTREQAGRMRARREDEYEFVVRQKKPGTWPAGWLTLYGKTGWVDQATLLEATWEWLLWQPELPFLWYELSDRLYQAGDYLRARRLAEVCVRIRDKETLVWFQLAAAQAALGEHDAAVDSAWRGLRLLELVKSVQRPQDVYVWRSYYYVKILIGTGQPKYVKRAFEADRRYAVGKKLGNSARYKRLMARAHQILGDEAKARQLLREAERAK